MPIIKLKDRPNYEGILFGVEFHNSVSEFSVESSELKKFNAAGYPFEVVENDLKVEKRLEKMNARLSEQMTSNALLQKELKSEQEKRVQADAEYVKLFDAYNQLKADKEELEAKLKVEASFVDRINQIRGK